MVASDLFIMNEQPTKLGYIRSEFISPLVQMGTLNPAGAAPTMQMPAEIYVSKDKKYTILLLRSGVCDGKMRPFGEALAQFVVSAGFRDISILTRL